MLLCDINMPRLDGIGLLRRVREQMPEPARGDNAHRPGDGRNGDRGDEARRIRLSDKALSHRASLSALVTAAAEKQQLKVDNQRLRAQIARTNASMPEIVAESPQMKEVLRLVRRVAPSDTSVLITGESGVGKELIAQAIHRLSTRSDKAFIDLNCAALQDTLLESELFGHEAGAFSGARHAKARTF